MNKISKHIPNTITCLNLFSGCLACLAAFNGQFELSAFYIGLAAIFDFLDGFLARILKAYSPLGKELDSLADLVSFGLAPGLLIFTFYQLVSIPAFLSPVAWLFPYTGFLIPIFSALRLAKFNIDTRQTTSFIGLPVPANALFWIGLIFYITENNNINAIVLTILILIFCYLLVSEIPMFSLKIKDLSWKSNKMRYILIVSTIGLIYFLGISGLAAVIGLYIILSLINTRLKQI